MVVSVHGQPLVGNPLCNRCENLTPGPVMSRRQNIACHVCTGRVPPMPSATTAPIQPIDIEFGDDVNVVFHGKLASAHIRTSSNTYLDKSQRLLSRAVENVRTEKHGEKYQPRRRRGRLLSQRVRAVTVILIAARPLPFVLDLPRDVNFEQSVRWAINCSPSGSASWCAVQTADGAP